MVYDLNRIYREIAEGDLVKLYKEVGIRRKPPRSRPCEPAAMPPIRRETAEGGLAKSHQQETCAACT